MATSLRGLLATFGGRVRASRKLRGLTQRDVAERSGVVLTYYGSIERGKRNVTLSTVLRIATALGVSPFELLVPRGRVARVRVPEADRIAALLERVSGEDRAAVLRVLEGFAAYDRST